MYQHISPAHAKTRVSTQKPGIAAPAHAHVYGTAQRVIAAALTLLLVATSLVVAAPAKAHADDLGLTISPVIERIELQAGQSYSSSFMLRNSSESLDANVNVYAQPFSVQEDDYDNVDFETYTPRTALAGWIDFSEQSFTLAPRETKTVDYSIIVPHDAPGGGQYATMFASVTGQESAQDGIGVSAIRRVGALVYAKVAGDVIERGNLVDQNLPWLQIGDTLDNSYSVANNGNVDFEVTHGANATPLFSLGGSTQTAQEPLQKNILPDTTRTVSLGWEGVAPGLYSVTQSVEFLGAQHQIGGLVLVGPWWFLVVVALIILMLLAMPFIIVKSVKKIKNRRQRRAANS